MKRFICFTKRVFIFLSFCLAGIVPAFSAGQTGRDIKIKIANSDVKDNPVNLTLASSDTKITGNFSVTKINLIVSNTSDRILEGELEFPLAEGESVTGYAIDVNGKLRDGVVVEKDKGRQVFEAVVRQGIDPGLVEKTVGNNFKTRIYPIPAKGIRQLQITVQGEVKNLLERKEGVFIETVGKDTFFYRYANGSKRKTRVKTLPKKLTVWWDVSSSGAKRDIKKETDFLISYIEKLSSPEVLIVPFCNEVQEAKSFKKVSSKEISEIRKFISSLEYDGATNSGYDFTELPGEEVLVFTDGIFNWNDGKKKSLSNSKKVVINTVNSSSYADHASLSTLAQKNGGVYVNLSGDASVNKMLSLLLEEPYRLIRAEFDPASVSDVYPQNGSVVDAGFAFGGLLKKKEAVVKLCFGYGTKVDETVEFKVTAYPEKNVVESELVARQWACAKIDSLSLDYDSNREKIIQLAKQFGVVTKDTSLIVLDNASDYVRYGIVPPKFDEQLYSEYMKLVQRNTPAIKNSDDSMNQIPDSVYRGFEEYKKWWNTDLSEFKKKKNKKTIEGPGGIMLRSTGTRSFSNEARTAVEADELVYEDAVLQYEASAVAAEPDARMEKSADRVPEKPGAKIQLQAWSSGAEYLTQLKKTPSSKMYAKYLSLKKDYEASPAFYMEVSDYFAEEGMQNESVRILSNLAELELENTDILRALAAKLMERKLYETAVPVFEKLVSLKSEVPQFLRDLGNAYYMNGEIQKAVETLYSVACRKWDPRFTGVEQIALNDMNAIIAEAERKNAQLDLSKFDTKLVENFDVDVRIVLTWNTDDCDIDLWVTDKDNEKCYYGNKITANGARMSRDFTQGYGPEEFCIRKAPGGSLKIEVNYFGNHQQKVLQPVTVQAEVYTNFGRKNQKREVLTLQLNDVKGTFLVGEVKF